MKFPAAPVFLVLYFVSADCQRLNIVRLNGSEPIISQEMFFNAGASPEEGANINGPSVIRIPDWILPEERADPSAKYYMYFAHHQGNYIRMAWAAELAGPWHLYQTGEGVLIGDRGVLDLGPSDFIDIGNSLILEGHIASPDVFVSDENRQIIMYFHGTISRNEIGQRTLVALSGDGLEFTQGIQPVILGIPYFRVFSCGQDLYAIAARGLIYRARDPEFPWLPPAGFDFTGNLWIQREDNPFQSDLDSAGFDGKVRHVAVFHSRDTLYVFYSRIGDSPERIQLSRMRLSNLSFDTWDPEYPPLEILSPAPGWEGGHIMAMPSEGASAPEEVNQLRDPYIFRDIDSSMYLFYTGKGEDAIGVAGIPGILQPL